MPTYCVEVCRISYATQVIDVEAKSLLEASDKALDMAGDYFYSEHDAEYEVNDIWLKTPS